MRTVLIADPDSAFATVLAESLRAMGGYSARLAATPDQARSLGAAHPPDLAIIDMGLPGLDAPALIQALRAARPGLPVLLIPFPEGGIPPDLDIQGSLTKPIFIPDLPALLESVLGPADEPALPGPSDLEAVRRAGPPGVRALPPIQLTPLIAAHIEALSHSVRDEPVMLTQGTTLVGYHGGVSREAALALAAVVAKAWREREAAGEVIRFEGGDSATRYMLYSVTVAGDAVLSVATRVRWPLLTLRRLVRETARELAPLVRG